jgi:hypothetical protein
MGCGLMTSGRASLQKWRIQTGASGARPVDFAPVRQLRQSLKGGREVAQLAQRLSRARASIRTDCLLRLRLGGNRADHQPNGSNALNLSCVVRGAKRHVSVRVMSNTNRALTEQKPRKERPIPRRLVQVIDALLDGTCKSQRAACERFNLSESYVSRSMKKDKIRVYLTRRTSEAIAASQLPATSTVLRLMEMAKSEHVQIEAAKHMLALNGYHANPTAPGVNINIGSTPAGYIVQLGNKDAEVFEGEVSEVGGVMVGRRMTEEERRTGILTRTQPGTMIDVSPPRAEKPSAGRRTMAGDFDE